MANSGLLPTGPLLESLIQICNEVSSMESPSTQVKNISTMIRRIRLLSSLFEEIWEAKRRLPLSSVLRLTKLFSFIQRVKLVIRSCKEGSCLWSLVQTEHISRRFHELLKEMGKALDILPLSLLSITSDIREQVELLHKQARQA